ncbi:hypothetical protein [Muricauda sp. MAR_2010_75]|uniref:hypothetical protein n=1 Tax=Allomuricauda sp. MAR_2010_75 TaxID=1250232 RepID=UPI00055CBAF4|nr:hypothetical protein [Muricauda sp. MAR_2010_75]
MKRLFLRLLTGSTLFCVLLSCSEEQDFDQFEDLSITPTVASSIFYLESDEETINAVPAGPFYYQTVNFDAFNEEYVAERLLEGTITYEIENTTSKRLEVAIEFLDQGGNVLDVELFEIDPNLPETYTREVTYGPTGKSLNILAATDGLRISGNNQSDTTSVSNASEPKVILRSAAEFLFRLK